MAGHIDRIISVIIIFFMLAFVPMLINGLNRDSRAYRVLTNEVQNFIDTAIDAGTVTNEMKEDLYTATSAQGMICSINIYHYMRVINPTFDGNTTAEYLLVGDTDNKKWSRGDKIVVSIEAIDYTGSQKVLYSILKFTSQRFQLSLAGRMRR